MKLTNEEKSLIVKLREGGLSYKKIADDVLGRESRSSTVFDYLKKYFDKDSIVTSDETAYEEDNYIVDNPRILFIDIETSPSISYHWKRWDENIGQEQVIQESIILTFSAKFLGKDEVLYAYVTEDEVRRYDDKRVVGEIYDILNKADIVVAHNGIRFDKKKINTRLLFNGYEPTKPYRLFDTLVSAKSNFSFPSNSLDNICAYLGLGRKLKHAGFRLWRSYMEGNSEAIERMVDYNMQDVIILEELYLKLRSWDARHPNAAVYIDNVEPTCPCCGSKEIELVRGELATTNVSGFEVYTCKSCGKKMRGRKNVLINRPKCVSIS